MFDRFYTVETGRGATGLGLSIAKALTERQGGRIQADVREGRLFITVCFPLKALTDGGVEVERLDRDTAQWPSFSSTACAGSSPR